jgi:flagellar protein FliS
MLYHGGLDATTSAREYLRAGDIPARSRSITKAHSILIELSNSLDPDNGGSIAANLAALYEYMQIRLLAANREQRDEPLAEVEGLLKTLSEAWDNCHFEPPEVPPAAFLEEDVEHEQQTVCCSY